MFGLKVSCHNFLKDKKMWSKVWLYFHIVRAWLVKSRYLPNMTSAIMTMRFQDFVVLEIVCYSNSRHPITVIKPEHRAFVMGSNSQVDS